MTSGFIEDSIRHFILLNCNNNDVQLSGIVENELPYNVPPSI